jgi:hypothetical protein
VLNNDAANLPIPSGIRRRKSGRRFFPLAHFLVEHFGQQKSEFD